MPNWNSWTMPVAMPIPKFTISIEPKNLVIRVQASLRTGSFENTALVCMIATRSESPMVSGTKMKWYTVVMPNCHRARSRASMDPSGRTTRRHESYGSVTGSGGTMVPTQARGFRAPSCAHVARGAR